MPAAMLKLAFLILVSTPAQEGEVQILMESLRSFGGEYSQATLYVVQANPSRTPCQALKAAGAVLVPLQMNEAYRSYPFADKVYACAQVEQLLAEKADTMVWLNPDCLILQPISEAVLRPGVGAAVRPVHLTNVGSKIGSPLDPFWSRIYETSGVSPTAVFPVESLLEGEALRPYFNSGFFAVRPGRGICQAWRASFEKLLADKSYQEKACSDEAHKIFLHQAVLSAVIISHLRKEEIHLLPSSYGYPLGLHAKIPEPRKAKSLDELRSVIYYPYTIGPNLEWMDTIPIGNSLKSWMTRRFSRQ